MSPLDAPRNPEQFGTWLEKRFVRLAGSETYGFAMKVPRHCVLGSTEAPFWLSREDVLAIPSWSIDKSSPEYRANPERMRSLVSELQARRAEAALGGSERSRERHAGRGKLLHTSRVIDLID